MTLAPLAAQIDLWVKKHLRDEEVKEYAEDHWVAVLLAVKPFKSNWTKAIKLSSITLNEEVDLVEFLLQHTVDNRDDLRPWKDMLASIRDNVLKIVHDVEVVEKTKLASKVTPAEDLPRDEIRRGIQPVS